VGVHDLEMLGLPDNRMDSMDFIEVVKLIEDKIKKFQPDTVLTHHPSDLNIDHRITQQALITACRPQPDCTVKNILFLKFPHQRIGRFLPECFDPRFLLTSLQI
jgi:LmbE family N-acetylglucosaminyl deacetylase